MRATAGKKQAFTDLVHGFFLHRVVGQVEAHAPRFGRNIGGQGRHIHLLAAAKCGLGDLGGIEALKCFHAGQQTGLHVLYPLRVGKVTRELHKGALDHARALAEVALFQ